MKYKEWLNEWLTLYVKSGVKPRTYYNYKDLVRLYILPRLGEYELADLTHSVLQTFIRQLLQEGGAEKRGLSSGTVCVVIAVVQSSMRMATDAGIPFAKRINHIQRPQKQEKRVECFSVTEQRLLETAVLWNPTSKNFGIVLTLYTGLRIGELLALSWDDIDFDSGILSVNGTCRDFYENGRFVKVIDSPKTYFSRRIIPLPKRILENLRILKYDSKSRYVVARGEKNISIRTFQKMFSTLLTRLRLPHRGFHSLRHTFATRALECGMDVKTLSEILGHKNPNVTLTRYAHSMLEHKISMMNKVGILLEQHYIPFESETEL